MIYLIAAVSLVCLAFIIQLLANYRGGAPARHRQVVEKKSLLPWKSKTNSSSTPDLDDELDNYLTSIGKD